MRFRIPGQDVHVRLFERVTTEDTQYDIFDNGLEYQDGTIDSIAVGGSFATVKRLATQADNSSLKKAQKRAKKAAKKAAQQAVTVEPTTAPEVAVA